MRCIETKNMSFIIGIVVMINNNMRCIETMFIIDGLTEVSEINNNMRCIETYLLTTYLNLPDIDK